MSLQCSLLSKIVVVFVKNPSTIYGIDWSVQLTENASNEQGVRQDPPKTLPFVFGECE